MYSTSFKTSDSYHAEANECIFFTITGSNAFAFLLGCTKDDHCTDEGFICDTTLQVCNGKFNNVLSKQSNETKKTKTSNTSFESLKPLDFKYVIS